MTSQEIETYLSIENYEFKEDMGKKIDQLLQEAICRHDEYQANYCWCLRQIYLIKKTFLIAINNLKTKNYENAWITFDNIDIELISLENNYDISKENDKFNLVFIGRIIKEYQKLFPYHYFFSRESVIKAEKCSICGENISLRHSCGHKVGKLYMGQLCARIVTDMDIKAIAIVTDPFDNYAYVKIKGQEYNYSMLEQLMTLINDPYDDFFVETSKVKRPDYAKINRNSLCPCGSGKKYKNCHLGTQDELMDYYKIHINKLTTI